MRVTAPSSWPWIDHLVSGLHPATVRPVRTRFLFGFPIRLTLPLNVSRRPIIQKVRRHPPIAEQGSDFLYACGFRICFTPLPGFFSPFPHGTCSLSVNDEYLALEDGPPIFRQDYTCPALLVVRPVPHPTFHIRGYHPLWPDFPFRFAKPDATSYRLLRFRSPLLSQSRLMSFPRATEMFQFARFAS